MNTAFSSEWIFRSLVIGAVALGCVWLCPAAWRGRVRRAVPVAAFLALVVLAINLLGPLPASTLVPAPLAGVTAGANWQLAEWLPMMWIAGAALCLLRLAAGFYAIWNLLRQTRPVPGVEWRELLAECQETLGLRGRLRLRLAGPDFIPSATGLLRRTVLLPDEALAWSQEQRRLVLLHELSHFRRGNLWMHALGRITCALHWFNPFVWLLQRQLAVEREFACDELVLERGAAPRDYATVLWQMATSTRRRPTSAAAYLAMASPRMGKLEQRVRRILAPAKKAGRILRLTDGCMCTALAALLVCTAWKPVQAKPASSTNLAELTGPTQAAAPANPWTRREVQTRLSAGTFAELTK